MNFSFSGDFIAHRPAQEVYDLLVDPNRFCPLLPDFVSVKVDDPQHFTVHVRVGVGHIGGTASVKLYLAEAEPPRHAAYEGKADMPGAAAALAARFELETVPEGTKVRWTGRVQLVGRLASLAGGMLEPLAKKNVQKLIAGLQSALG